MLLIVERNSNKWMQRILFAALILIFALIGKYIDMFGEGFPTYQVFRSRTTEECIEIVKQCIDQNKTAYDLGYCTDDDNIEY